MIALLLAQVAVESGWSPTTINLLIGGAVIIISALSAAIVKIIQTVNETRKTTKETKDLVDGRYGALLTEVAEVRKLLAASTGSLLDKGAAIAATATAEAQQAVVDKVNGKNGHPA